MRAQLFREVGASSVPFFSAHILVMTESLVTVLNGPNQAWKDCCQHFHRKSETFTSEARLVVASAIFANRAETSRRRRAPEPSIGNMIS
jgi:hypothetical protein